MGSLADDLIVYCIEYRLAADLLFIIIIQSRGTRRLIPRDLSGFDFDLDEVWTPSDNTATKASGTPHILAIKATPTPPHVHVVSNHTVTVSTTTLTWCPRSQRLC